MKYKWLTVVVTAIVAAACFCGCKRQSQLLNDDLKLSDREIQEYTQRASNGDAEAAKKLWHHYDFFALNVPEGEKWRHVYEELKHEASPPEHSQDH
jgi:hypothetical protein